MNMTRSQTKNKLERTHADGARTIPFPVPQTPARPHARPPEHLT